MVIIWAAALIGFVAIEAATVGLVSIWFAVGAFGALVCALLHLSLWVQLVVFAVLTAAALGVTRPLAKKYLAPKYRRTNADRVLEQIGVVTEKIDNLNQTGAVTAGGRVWTARSADDSIIEPGVKVRAVRIEGVKLVVRPQEAAEPVSSGI